MLLHDGEHHFRPGAEARPEFDPPPFDPFPPPPPEERIVPLTGVPDLDLQAFERFFRSRRAPTEEEPRRATEEDLLDFGLLGDSGGERAPTLYGILGFGRTPQIHPRTTSFLIRCAAYAGEDRGTEVILAGVADGRLDEQVRRALGWFRSLGWREKYEGLLREDLPRLPPEALREALANAVAHRDYGIGGSAILLDVFADRAEITSPGTLADHRTVDSVRAGGATRARNPKIAHLLVAAGLMERRGRGWPLMRDAMREFNGTEPDLFNYLDGGYFRVTLRFHGPDPRPAADRD